MHAPLHALLVLVIAIFAGACSAESGSPLALGDSDPAAALGSNPNGAGARTDLSATQDAAMSRGETDTSVELADGATGPASDALEVTPNTDSGDSPPQTDSGIDDPDGVISGEDSLTEPDTGSAVPDAAAEGGDATSTECDDGEVVDCIGGCSPGASLGDGDCDLALNCEDLAFDDGDCDGECGDGACDDAETHVTCPEDCDAPVPPDNHPCEVSGAPGANDAAITDCVCALDAWCCTSTWDAFCVQLAEESCEAPCDCTTLACDVDSDCEGCFGDACIGMWACSEGACVQGAAMVCEIDSASGCFINQCEPETGACVSSPSDSLCDDGSACTLDSCDVMGGLCVYTDSEVCGEQHPCLTSDAPGSGDEASMACLCEVDPYCCQTAWDAACVTGASESCGFSCDCTTAPPESLACDIDADCAWCGDGACTGPFICVDGGCEASAPVVCDDADDSACSKSMCEPTMGTCAVMTSDVFCDDGDPCTLDVCQAETGACESPAIEGCGETHPCMPGPAPLSSDSEMNACACAEDANCCSGPWSDACVAVAQVSCGLECNCQMLEPEALSCTSNAECMFCDDANLCNGTWLCQGGQCVATAPVSCDTSADAGCLSTVCAPSTGACEQTLVPSLCDDADPCTEDECDAPTGGCVSQDNPACGLNHPCVSAPLPTSSDPIATACVCEINPYCCTGAWDGTCVATAEAQCGQVCSCGVPEAPVACIEDGECAGCDDGDLCNGTWGCVGGVCAPLDEVVSCPSSEDVGCLVNSCAPDTGHCELSPEDAACEDGDLCTTHSCDAEGGCIATPIAGCSLSHPCAASSTPQSTNAEITACVCAVDPWCCDSGWDEICVNEAINECGALCDCADPASEASCGVDADCGWCTDNLCDTPWGCSDGLCVAVGASVTCETSEDTECLANQCDVATGACVLGKVAGACDDDAPCTLDSCGADGTCTHEDLEGCEGVPPFDCLGTGEPSADGCGIVSSYEGCCDPWGRVTWCQDGDTYCIACQENPSCGWQGAEGYYDCGNEATGDPSGAAPIMCPAYGP
jgi:hypothetical protein